METRADERGALVVFPEAHGVDYWHARNAASPTPGEWPYGLDGLSEYGRVRTTEAPNRGLAVRMAQRVAGPRRLPSGGAEVEVALCWNEATVLPMIASVRAKRMVSGVIWATDATASRAQDRQVAMIRRGLREMDALWCLSRPQVDRLQEWLASDGPVVHFLRFGVDSNFYAPVPYPERPLVASVGGDRDRDPGTLLEALDRVTRARPDVRCVVQSRSAVSAPKAVEVIPSLPHVGVRDLIGRASVVAMATRPNWHASGMTVALEAMSIGRPVVGSRTPGMDDYVEVGKTGNLVPPQDPEALAEAILDLLDDPDRAAEWGANGTRAVQQNFTTAVMCRSLADIVWS